MHLSLQLLYTFLMDWYRIQYVRLYFIPFDLIPAGVWILFAWDMFSFIFMFRLWKPCQWGEFISDCEELSPVFNSVR